MQTPKQTGGMRELHAKEEVGWGGGAHRGWCSVGERGDGERLWVSAWSRCIIMKYVCLLL